MTEVPVNARSFSRPIDDESLEYLVSFKNVGQEIVTFDYTLADIPKVPHVDAGGPNSGLIENLYPGAQVEIKNPFKTTNIYISMGKVVVGKLTPEAVKARYNFSNAPAPLIPTLDIPSI